MLRSNGVVLAAVLCTTLMGCTVVLAPSRRQGGGADDAATTDAGPTPDTGPRPDGGDAGGGDDPDGGGDAGVDGGTDAGPLCPTGTACEAAAPGGWNGPVILLTGDGVTTPSCPASAPSNAFTGFSGLDFDPADCSCSCGAPIGTLGCGTTQLIQTNSSCITVGTTFATFSDDQCRSVSTLSTTGGWTLSAPTFVPGSATCTPSATTDTAPITWSASYTGCGFGTPSSCGTGSVCVPERESGQRLCVWVEGEATCPAAFPEELDVAGSANDTRDCSTCTCGPVTGSCRATLNIANGCPGTLLDSVVSSSGCTTAHSVSGLSGTANLTPTGACTPSGGAPTGTVVPAAPRTVCCIE